MPRMSAIPFPEIDVDEAAAIAERIVKEFRGAVSISGLARALKMAERGGGFLKKAAALREYGLIEGRGELRATERAQRIAYPSSTAEATRARGEAFLDVELFRALADRLGSTIPEEDSFAIFVEEVTHAPRMEVARRVSRLRRIYVEGAKYLPGQEDAIGTTLVAPAAPPSLLSAAPSASSPNIIELRTTQVQMRLPLNKASIALLITALENLRENLNETPNGGQSGRDGNEDA